MRPPYIFRLLVWLFILKDSKGIKGWIMKPVMKRAGAGVPSANRITLLRDINDDGIAETRTIFLQGLNSPFGMELAGNDFYVANTDRLVRFLYHTSETQIIEPGVKVIDLPAGPTLSGLSSMRAIYCRNVLRAGHSSACTAPGTVNPGVATK